MRTELRRRLGSVARLGVFALCAQAVVLLLLWLAAARAVHNTSIAAADALAQRVGARLAAPYIELAQSGRTDELLQRARADADRFGVHITLAQLDGRILADAAPTDSPDALSAAGALLRGGRTAARVDTDQGSWTYTRRVVSGEPAALTLRVGAPGLTAGASRAIALTALLPVGLAGLAITAAVAAFVSIRAARDVRALEDDARRVAAGDTDARIASPRSADLVAVADAFNDALDAMEAEIRKRSLKHRRARAVVRSMPSGVMVLDAEQRVLSLNRVAERLLGVNEEVARGRLLQEALRQPALNSFVAEAFDTEAPTSGELELEGDDPATVQAASRALHDAEGAPAGRVLVLYDVTRLRRLERVRRDFAANVSHELRTPITNIKGYVETMLELGPDEADASRRFLEVVARNVDRLQKIVEGMLDLARLEDPAAATALEVARTEARSLLEGVCAQQREAAAARGVTLRVDAPQGLAALMNRRLVEQAMQNLVSNAIKHGPEGGEVLVSAQTATSEQGVEMLELSVQDQGPGIEKRHQVRIFERFYRVDPARTREGGGAGLGLAIVKHIARLHAGREGVRSALGRGSTFWIRIPVAGPPGAVDMSADAIEE